MRFFRRAAAVLVIALAFVGSFNIMSMALDREPPIEYEGAAALAPAVPQGGSIEVEFSVFRKRICPIATRRWLTDAGGVRHNIAQFTTGPRLLAGRETYRRTITVPPAAALGPARYQVTLDYTCNPLQKLIGPIKVASPPVRFEIVPGPEGPAQVQGSDG